MGIYIVSVSLTAVSWYMIYDIEIISISIFHDMFSIFTFGNVPSLSTKGVNKSSLSFNILRLVNEHELISFINKLGFIIFLKIE